jgi:exodeoxyribonuclease-5
MTDVILTDAQEQAIEEIVDWYENRSNEQQVFRLFGFAGTGKTTITKHAIGELGLNMYGGERKVKTREYDDSEYEDYDEYLESIEHDSDSDEVVPEVLFGAYTGKASYVMRKHGTPAKTIHSLIYSVIEATEREIEEANKKLAELETAAIKLHGMDRVLADAQIEALRMRIKEMKFPRFGLNPESDVRRCKLLVLDEVSMVGHDMAKDVLSFGKPILVLGDPGQLPPIKGEGAFTQQEPDIMLHEIHRQAQESAIIRLATLARQGKMIPYGKHDNFVWKMSKRGIEPAHLLNAEQVICGRNATRFDLNNAMRRQAGFDISCPYPTSPAERIICLKNNNSKGLINGMFLSISDSGPLKIKKKKLDGIAFSGVIETEEGKEIGEEEIYLGHFLDHIQYDPNRHDRDWKEKKNLIEATFGWAITCHKAQGSQFKNVIVWDDHLGRTNEDRARWLYTAITRAEEGLVILD